MLQPGLSSPQRNLLPLCFSPAGPPYQLRAHFALPGLQPLNTACLRPERGHAVPEATGTLGNPRQPLQRHCEPRGELRGARNQRSAHPWGMWDRETGRPRVERRRPVAAHAAGRPWQCLVPGRKRHRVCQPTARSVEPFDALEDGAMPCLVCWCGGPPCRGRAAHRAWRPSGPRRHRMGCTTARTPAHSRRSSRRRAARAAATGPAGASMPATGAKQSGTGHGP